MVRSVLSAVVAALLATSAAGQSTTVTPAAGASQPMVVELFTAQGCAECPPANAWASELASSHKDMVVLTWPVDYWDYLGWRDTFAHPAFGTRQRAYGLKLGMKDVYTPQIVVGGRAQTSGANLRRATGLLKLERAPPGPRVTIDAAGRRAYVGGGAVPNGGAEVWLVRYDPRLHTTTVPSGENRGAHVQQRNVVRELVRLGPWTGRPRAYALPARSAGPLKSVVLVQGYRRQGVLAVGRD